jgi:hypothetical protein
MGGSTLYHRCQSPTHLNHLGHFNLLSRTRCFVCMCTMHVIYAIYILYINCGINRDIDGRQINRNFNSTHAHRLPDPRSFECCNVKIYHIPSWGCLYACVHVPVLCMHGIIYVDVAVAVAVAVRLTGLAATATPRRGCGRSCCSRTRARSCLRGPACSGGRAACCSTGRRGRARSVAGWAWICGDFLMVVLCL